MFCTRSVTLWKIDSHEPPHPSEITVFEPPLRLGIFNDLPCGGGGGYGNFLEPHLAWHSWLSGSHYVLPLPFYSVLVTKLCSQIMEAFLAGQGYPSFYKVRKKPCPCCKFTIVYFAL